MSRRVVDVSQLVESSRKGKRGGIYIAATISYHIFYSVWALLDNSNKFSFVLSCSAPSQNSYPTKRKGGEQIQMHL